MASNDVQETLDRILFDLRSDETTRQLAAIHELGTITYSSEAIVRELERLALREEGALQKFALAALSSTTSQYVASQRSLHTKFDRNLILKEIDEWQKDELIELRQAEVLRRHYDFDIKRAAPPLPSSASVVEKPVQSAISEESMEQIEKPQEISQQITATSPRPSLMQTLLSEASIKIYLYLGAFFVIASALILAALVEAARLPILAVATLAFGGGALAIHKRLPQPSFALFIVFSFLLPIDANVVEETIAFVEPSLSIYWTVIFLMMTAIWGFSIWFYQSRFFSAVAFVSLSLAFYRAGQIFNTEIELQIFLGMLASLTGLAGTFVLRRWKDNKFSLPVFLLAQLQVFGLLFISFALATLHSFDSGFSNRWWILIALTWLTGASFYVLSDLLNPTFFFPWMAAGALLPLPWFLLITFNVTEFAYALGFWIWGALFATASEGAFQFAFEKSRKYHWPLLVGSALLFLAAFVLVYDGGRPGFIFAIFGLSALVYSALHGLRPRWYVWSGALLSALCAYFAFFQMPAIANFEVPLVYQLLIASTLLLLPELFTTAPLSLKSESRWPALAFGAFVSMLGIIFALADFEHIERGALVLFVYGLLFTLHAVQSNRPWLGYFATASEALAIVFALNHFNLDLWLPALTALIVIYYATGFFLRRSADNLKTWGNVLINSGLTLGALLSLIALLSLKETSGWYILVIALFFAVELFARSFVLFEIAVEILLSFSLALILHDVEVPNNAHFLFGGSLIWLGGDLIFGRLVPGKRIHRPITLVAGYILVFLSVFTLWSQLNPFTPTIYFSLYAAFFMSYAFLQREPRLGYLAAAFPPLALIKFCDALNFEKWIFPLIALAVLYYAGGYWLRRTQKAVGWDQILLYSGLGLGVLTSIAAPYQSGLDTSIPVAIAATVFAVEAFALRNVWWALPANALYLMSYFVILFELDVEEPQYYSIGAALLGILMHYLLTRAGSKTGTFVAGMLSQLVLLGTTYIQMVSTERLSFFFVLFVQSMIVLIYGLIQRSRSLVITPIVFAVIGVMTVIYSALKGLGPVILIGSTGILLLMTGIVAVLMRERITRLGEQLSDWKP
jgi:hypothetical protein